MVEDKFTGIEDELDILQENDNSIKNRNVKETLKTIFMFSPLVLSIIGSVAFSNFLIFMIGIGIAGGQVVVGQSIKMFKELKKVKIDKLNDDSVGVEASDFYTDQYKQYLNIQNSPDNKKYQEIVEKQQSNIKGNFKVHEGYKLLSKEDVMFKITRGLEVYSKVYKIPPINVSNEEWDKLFSEMYEMYEESFKVSFYTIMLKLVKFTLASSLLNNKDEININTFIDNIPNVVNIKNSDLRELRSDVVSDQKQKIIEFKIAK